MLSGQISARDTLACCLDVKETNQPTHQQTASLALLAFLALLIGMKPIPDVRSTQTSKTRFGK